MFQSIISLTDSFNSSLQGVPPSRIVAASVATTLGVLALKDVVQNFDEFKGKVVHSFIAAAKQIPMVAGKIDSEQAKLVEFLRKEFDKIPGEKFSVIPEKGLSHEDVLKKLRDAAKIDEAVWKTGKVSGTVYAANEKHIQLLNEAYSIFSLSNPLHPDVFPSIRKFEGEIVRMTISMLHGDQNCCGNVTSGGTESILLAMKAYRDTNLHIKHPEMLIPVTAHAAFEKAGLYFGIKLVKVPVDPKNFTVQVNEVKKRITRNTIVIIGSAPNYPYGTIDPIPELAALAKENGIGFHTDACLGGYYLPWVQKFCKEIIPFDFSVPGVTSISCDTHKYAFTTKGTSVISFRTAELRHGMYSIHTEWPGGQYATATMAGSRPGGLSASCWASLVSIGQDGFLNTAKKIFETTMKIKDGIKLIPGLSLMGDSYSSVIAFESKEFNIFSVGDVMSKKGWHLNSLQKPSAIHICLSQQQIGKSDIFLSDLREAVEWVRTHPEGIKDGLAPVYGLAGSFPDRGEVKNMMKIFLDVCNST